MKRSNCLKDNRRLMKEYDFEKNKKLGLNLDKLTNGSNKKVWWKCSKGHEWQADIYNRVKGIGCPYCSGRYPVIGKTDLATTNTELLKEWDYEKNGSLKPTDVKAGTNKKVWWKCSKGHEWQAIINNRKKGKGCPYCSGVKVLKGFNDLMTMNPKLAKEWNYEKNEKLSPDTLNCNSNKIVWWKCSKGHEWQAKITTRNYGYKNCPVCKNSK